MADSQSRLAELVKTFERHIETYRSPGYNETQLRREFIDPFFEDLGWDVTNKAGNAHAYKDVIHEDAISVGSATKAPDYCFRIGGTRKFFLKAKKPSINIKDDPEPAYQLRRYAWSAGLPLSILTDFGEFAVYDCLSRPKQTDKASTARIMYLTYNQYLDNWSKIADIFAREAVLKGSFDKFAASTKGKRGTTTVDVVFLAEIEKWRDMLAKIIALRNRNLSQPEINFAVQCTIDRILFLRMCEDRGIERYGQLQSISSGDRTYPRLCEIFERADQKYNSGLFHFHDEPGRTTPPDTLTPSIAIDDKDLKWILYNLYYPQCPYEFSVLPPEILGNVYEQFLGKVIILTPAHHAKIEDKPEVKKAGGVYYTPSYIVDYIVKNTVGKLVEGKTPKQIENIKILDPACGSGSFLLGAYTCLLNYHRDWYVAHNGSKHSKKIYQGRAGHHFLTIAEKKRILLNNIFGVDIDSQAVEVTKLSLLLKVLEGENSQTLENQYRLFHERALPDLASNVKCGNSLIAPDFFENGWQPQASPEPARRAKLGDGASQQRNTQYPIRNTNNDLYEKINPFDWKQEFPNIFNRKNPGFDAVIGNPPYIPTESMVDSEKHYFRTHYEQLERKYDSSVIFILAMLAKLRQTGRLGFISSVTWQTGENYRKLRERLFTTFGVETLVNLPFDVFKKAYVDTGVYILSGKPSSSYAIYRFPKKEQNPDLAAIAYKQVPTHLVSPPDYKIILAPAAMDLMTRFRTDSRFTSFGDITISTQGLASNRFRPEAIQRTEQWYPFLAEGQVYRYTIQLDHIQFVDIQRYPSLKQFYDSCPKLLVRRIVSRQDRLMATYSNTTMVFKKDINPFVITTPSHDGLYALGIFNSRLISYLYVNTSSIATKDDFRQTTLAELRALPIRTIDFDNRDDKAMHDKMVKLVVRMLDLHKKLAAARVPDEKTKIQRQIDTTDRQIDHLVYKLYNLTDEEIKIIEESTK